jgi:hypothetical protein
MRQEISRTEGDLERSAEHRYDQDLENCVHQKTPSTLNFD